MVLASTQGDTSINELAQLADKIIEVAVPQVASVSTQPSSSDIESLRVEIVSLKQHIKTLQHTPCRGRSSRCCSTSPALPPEQSSDTVCWYHRTFGNASHKCTPPCSRQGNEMASH